KISMRDKSLEIINTAMQRDAETKIKYAAKQSSISNAHKKWIGESKGLKRLNAIVTKQEFEQQFTERINQNPQYKNQYGHLLQSFDTIYKRYNDYLFAREMFIELFYYGPENIQFASEFTSLVDELLSEEPNSDKTNGL